MTDEVEVEKLTPWQEAESRWDELVYIRRKDRIPRTIGDFANAIINSNGIMTYIAETLDVHWLDARHYVQKYPFLSALFDAERQKIIDMAEDVVQGNVRTARIQHRHEQLIAQQNAAAGTPTAPRQIESSDSRWFLARMGKDRGYGDQVSVDVSAGKPIPIAIVQPGELEGLLPREDDPNEG